jgi:ATP-binding cassette, subfamily B, bacterial
MSTRPFGYRALLAAYLAPQWRRAALLAALLLGGICLELAGPQILSRFIDAAGTGAPIDGLARLALLFLALALVQQLIGLGEAYVAENVGLTATNALRADLTLHCLRLDTTFHNAHPPGELIERVDGDVAKLGNFFSRFVVQIVGNAILLLGVVALSFLLDWRAGVGLGAFAIVASAVLYRLRSVGIGSWQLASQAEADLHGFFEERASGTEDLRANGATSYAMLRLHERNRAMLRTWRRASFFGSFTFSTSTLLLALGTAVALGLGAWLFHAGEATVGAVYLLFAYAELLRRPIETLSREIEDLQRATASIRRIAELLGTRSALADGGRSALPAGPLSIAFEAVSFAYQDDDRGPADADRATDATPQPEDTSAGGQTVLSDVSFTVRAGETLGLLGRTGSGKTTIARLLFRLYDPLGGTVRLAGVDLRDVPLADVRRRVGVVTQDIQLFHATVRDNLTFFDRAIPDERILAVLRDLELERWYGQLPDGLDTLLAPDGGGLSAGEAQLLAFARVFLKDPGLVILDEASSRLDPATERAIERAIDRLLAGRTAVIIAHRLATVERADSIMVLEGGRVLEHGPRRALAADRGSRFAALLRTGLEEALA